MELDLINSKLFYLSFDKKEIILDKCKIIDVSFHCPDSKWRLYSVTFRNFYSSSVSILYKLSLECDWTTCFKEKKLMPHNGSERGSQDVVVLNRDHCCLADSPAILRVVLKQPCENWKDFGLHDLKCVGVSNTDSITTSKSLERVYQPTVDVIQRMLSTKDHTENYNITYLSLV